MRLLHIVSSYDKVTENLKIKNKSGCKKYLTYARTKLKHLAMPFINCRVLNGLYRLNNAQLRSHVPFSTKKESVYAFYILLVQLILKIINTTF